MRVRASALVVAAACCDIAVAGSSDTIFGDGFDGFGPALCDEGIPSHPADPIDYARALGLCSGVVDATWTLADGNGEPAALAHAVRRSFGPNNTPLAGSTMVQLSTGIAGGPADEGYVAPEPGDDAGITSDLPADWLAANLGTPPHAPSCPSAADLLAHDPVMLTLDVRVPANAHAFSLAVDFFAADYAEYVCGDFNDVFVALLDSGFAGTPANPLDGNLATLFVPGGDAYPLGVNLAPDTGAFTQCRNGPIGCQSGNPSTMSACVSPAGLAGTGFDVDDPNGCDSGAQLGGGTGWLRVQGNVVPGETIRLRLGLWDVGDGGWDSLVILDDFRWSPDTVVPGTTIIAP